MRYLFAALPALFWTVPAQAEDVQKQVAKRFIASIESGDDFFEADFVVPPNKASETVLRSLNTCNSNGIKRPKTYVTEPRERFVEQADRLSVTFSCKGVSSKSPVGISLNFNNNRITQIETHNFDLLEASNG